MKPQDTLFVIVIFVLLVLRGRYAHHLGILSFVVSALLFSIGNLYTAQRLSWYAAAFIALGLAKNTLTLLFARKVD